MPTETHSTSETVTPQDAPSRLDPWWGELEVPPGKIAHWHLGPLRLWIRHRHQEWRIACLRDDDPHSDETVARRLVDEDDVPDEAEILRYASREPGDVVVLSPLLADRTVVARPESPFHVLPGDEIVFFVSTPVSVEVGLPGPRRLLDIPTVRLSDTWFGSNTLSGTLCYASTTQARLHLENVPRSSHWAVTEIRLQNRADDALRLERVNLPAPSLGLYQVASGQLWTQPLTMRRRAGGGLVEVHLGTGPPALHPEATPIGEPRERPAQNILVRALDALLR